MSKVIFIVLLLFSTVYAGPLAYGICQTGCNAVAVAYYAAAGTTFGAGHLNTIYHNEKILYTYLFH